MSEKKSKGTRRVVIAAGMVLLTLVLMMAGISFVLAEAATPGMGMGQAMHPQGEIGIGYSTGTPGGMMSPGAGGGMIGQGAPAGGYDFDRHFIEQMIPHHEDAITMASLGLPQANHTEIKDLARSIRSSQSAEIDQMRLWYKAWYDTDVRAEAVNGMMGWFEAKAIDGAVLFDKAFIEQMVPHHQMAIMMFNMHLSHFTHPELQNLIRSIITVQTGQINQMSRWYQDWYKTALPASGQGGMMMMMNGQGGMMDGRSRKKV